MPPEAEPQTLDEVMDAISPDLEQPAEIETPQSNETQAEELQEESYTRIDPKTLAPELQPLYRSLLRDYTKKTQSIAQQRREFEEERKQFQQPQPIQAVQEQVEQNVHPGMSVDEYTAFMLSKVEEKLTEQQQRVLEEQNQKYLDKAVVEFESTDERLNPESPAFDEYMRTAIGTKLDEQLASYTEENGSPIGFDYQAQTQELIEQYEKYTEKKAKEMAELKTKQAFNGVRRTASLGVKGSTAPSKSVGGMSLDEAIDNAFSS